VFAYAKRSPTSTKHVAGRFFTPFGWCAAFKFCAAFGRHAQGPAA
jgi:hypothetical protein